MLKYTSLFIVSLHYERSLAEIDGLMKKHIAFLQKHYTAGNFLVSGRKVPRTGGIIIARASDKKAVEQLMKSDPFCKHKLATFEITEFLASQQAAGIKQWLQR